MRSAVEQRVLQRVGDLLREAMQQRACRYADLPAARDTVRNAIFGHRTLTLAMLVRLADAMNFDVVIQLRDRQGGTRHA